MTTRMLNRALRSPPPSPVKPPERCPYCVSPKIATKGRRPKKLETVRLYHCHACDRRFTPGPRALRKLKRYMWISQPKNHMSFHPWGRHFALKLRAACTGLLVLFLLDGGIAASAATIQTLGIAVTPAHFPRQSGKDVEDMFRLGKQAADAGIFIYQWSQPDFQDVASKVVAAARSANLIEVVALSPTRLDGTRGEYDLPDAVRKKAGRNPSFRDQNVNQAFVSDALQLARLKVPYLCLATEINFLAFKDIKEYINFAAVYKQV